MSVPSYHPVFRVNPDGSLRTDMIVEMGQKREAPFSRLTDRFGTFPMRGGATVIISKPTLDEQERGLGAPVRFVIAKQLHGREGDARESRQRQYLQRLGLMEGKGADRFQINFQMVHEGL